MSKLFLTQALKLLISFPIIFLLSGRLDYWQGWVFLSYILLLMVVGFVLFKDKVELGKERLHPGPGTKPWDKVYWVLSIIFTSATIVLSILDTGRFYWSAQLPIYVYMFSYIVLFLACAMMFWAMHTNKWFSSVVRIQKDRKQEVCEKGPYEIIRHPGYLGAIFMYVYLPLVFGSIIGLMPALFLIKAIMIRTYLEDRTLKKELKGYKAYSKKVKYRLFPGFW